MNNIHVILGLHFLVWLLCDIKTLLWYYRYIVYLSK